MKKITYRKLQGLMWSLGMPMDAKEARRFADLYRSLLKTGMADEPAFAMVKMAYHVERGYSWCVIPDAEVVALHVKRKNAAEFPDGKDAAELAGRPWPAPASMVPKGLVN